MRAFAWSGRIRLLIGKRLTLQQGEQGAVTLNYGIMVNQQCQGVLVKETRVW